MLAPNPERKANNPMVRQGKPLTRKRHSHRTIPVANSAGLIQQALAHAITALDMSVSATARLLKVDRGTVANWLAGETLADVGVLSRHPRFWKAFFRCWTLLERKAGRI